MRLVGLTGGIGSGKSTVAKMLEEAGATVVDADQIARDIMEPGRPALQDAAYAFGSDILNPDGSLDRGKLAERAFASREATDKLNRITHPRIGEQTRKAFRKARERGDEVVVYDMPLLVDKGLDKDMDLVLVVDVEPEERVNRLVGRGLTADDARARIKAQIPDDKRRAAADIVIDNNGSLEDLRERVEAIRERVFA
ncbi:dephospho-CoA kinase [Corynebacterium sp. 32222D000AT]|nr:dephospho-CoA kinase [Mycobacteriaceae bacterium]MDY5830170.1 dephospho-CoA kinase [Corynebacterium sp.]